MARNGSGVYSLPAGSTVTNGDTSDATDVNTPLVDLETDMNTARPIVAGGTGASSASAARTNLGVAIGSDVQAYDANLPAWPSTVDATEVGYLNGVTSSIQTQIDSKAASADVYTETEVDNLLAAIVDGVGIGQTWQDVLGSRAHSTSYENTTGQPIQLFIAGSTGATLRNIEASATGAFAGEEVVVGQVAGAAVSSNPVIPVAWFYRVDGVTTINQWSELR